MKNLTLSIGLMSTFVGFAHANEELMNRTAFEGRFTRPEVHAAFMQARADGTLPDTSEAGSMQTATAPDPGSAAPQLTREQVTAEYLRARADGTLLDTGESGSMHAPVFAQSRPERPEIDAGAIATAAVGANE